MRSNKFELICIVAVGVVSLFNGVFILLGVLPFMKIWGPKRLEDGQIFFPSEIDGMSLLPLHVGFVVAFGLVSLGILLLVRKAALVSRNWNLLVFSCISPRIYLKAPSC